MYRVRVLQNLETCRLLWERLWTKTCIFDLWPVRACFMKHYRRRPFFLLVERNGREEGLLALSWIEEEGYFGHFPGETWQGKTWIEQNKIPLTGPRVFQTLMENSPGRMVLRYLDIRPFPVHDETVTLDEIGYLFFPKQYNYSFDIYLQSFSKKTRKKLDRELQKLHAQKVTYRYNHPADLDRLFEMNLSLFGDLSYFHDRRFFNAFVDLIVFLDKNNLLRMTTVLIGGRVAAVDVGALWRGTYTVMAGGTNPDFPGIAKLINFHHLEEACRQRLAVVDFLCGDFNWKSRFHLTPRPLYKICSPAADAETDFSETERMRVCAS